MSITATEKWWSARQIPSKQDANPTEGDTTDYKCKALSEDGTYLYAGVHNWIIRYDMTTGDALKIGEVEWGSPDLRVSYLEVDGTDLHYVVEFTEEDISLDEAHTRAWGTIDLTDVASHIYPDGGVFYKYDKGCRVDSLEVMYHNYRLGGEGMEEGTCRWFTQTIGWGTPAPFKDGGIPKLLAVRSEVSTFPAPAGQHHVHVGTSWVEQPSGDAASKPYEQYVGNYVWAVGYDSDNEVQTQWLGKCTDIIGHKSSGTWIIQFEHPLEYALTSSIWTHSYVYLSTDTPGAHAPYENIFVPTYMEAEVGYYFDEITDRPRESVRVERKWRKAGFESFFYPDTVADADEGESIFLDPGWHSFVSSMSPEQFTNSLSQEEAYGSKVCQFYIDFSWIDKRQQYLLSEGMVVENNRQDNKHSMCGWNTVTVNGVDARWLNDAVVTCPGNIYLYKDPVSGDIYVMVNEVRQSIQPDVFTKVRIGRWNSTDSRFEEVFHDRDAYTDSPKYYPNIDSYVGHELCVSEGSIYGFRRKYQRNWTDTELVVGFAAPPQTASRPSDWLGGLSATILVRGDRTDLFTTPGVIRTNDVKKTFRISEVDTVTRQLDGDFIIDSWDTQIDLYTMMVVRSIRPMNNWDAPPVENWWGIGVGTSYANQVAFELLGETLSVSQGYDIRDEVFVIEGNNWVITKEVYFENIKELEGQTDPDNPLKETHNAVTDDDWTLCPRFSLNRSRVRNVSSVMIDEQDFTVTDITNELTISIPDTGTVYVKRNQGIGFDETYVYVHNKYLDDEFDVEYTYYPIGELQSLFVYDNTIFYNYSTEDYNIWLKDHQDNWSPGVNERGIYSNVVELDGTFYTITQPSYALRQYTKDWSEHIEEFKTNKRGWDILGQISGANDQVLYEWNGTYVLGDDSLVYRGEIDNIVSITREDIPPFEEVEISYINGTYYSAETKASTDDSLTYKRMLSYVSDYIHAKTIGDNILTFYSDIRSKYTVVVDEYRHDIRFGDVYDINNVRGKVVEIELLGRGMTKLVLYELYTINNTSLTNINQTLR